MPKTTTSSAWWRILLACLFVAAATVAIVGSVVTRYTRDNLLDTEGYLKIISPLPKDPAVSEALAKYATQAVIDTTNTQQAIKELLPPKLSPLSAPLTKALEEKVNEVAKNIIRSDNFSSIWITAQKSTHENVIRLAESQPQTNKLEALASLNISRLFGQVRNFLGLQPILSAKQKDQARELIVDLHQSINNLRATVKAIKTGAYILPYAAVAFLLVAIAVAYNRRKTVMGIGIVLIILGTGTLIGFKIITNQLLSDVQDPTYRAAAQAIYEAFYGNLRLRLEWVTILGAVLTALAIAAGPYQWAIGMRKALGLNAVKRTKASAWAHKVRLLTANYFWWLAGVGLAVAIVSMLFITNLTPETATVILCLFIIYFSILHLIAKGSPSRRSKPSKK